VPSAKLICADENHRITAKSAMPGNSKELKDRRLSGFIGLLQVFRMNGVGSEAPSMENIVSFSLARLLPALYLSRYGVTEEVRYVGTSRIRKNAVWLPKLEKSPPF
jgi:hypothetical protein